MYTIAIKGLFFFKKYRVTDHQFQHGYLELMHEDGSSTIRPVHKRTWRLIPDQKSFAIPEIENLRLQELAKQTEELKLQLKELQRPAPQPEPEVAQESNNLYEQRRAEIIRRAQERTSYYMGDGHAEVGSGRVLQGAVQSPNHA